MDKARDVARDAAAKAEREKKAEQEKNRTMADWQDFDLLPPGPSAPGKAGGESPAPAGLTPTSSARLVGSANAKVPRAPAERARMFSNAVQLGQKHEGRHQVQMKIDCQAARAQVEEEALRASKELEQEVNFSDGLSNDGV